MQATKNFYPVIINGAGIGGLTFASALATFGVNPLLIEPNKTANSDSAITLCGPALMSLKTLGLEDDLLKKGILVKN